jgi:hypothetical protein
MGGRVGGKAPNTKSQDPEKIQIPKSKLQGRSKRQEKIQTSRSKIQRRSKIQTQKGMIDDSL